MEYAINVNGQEFELPKKTLVIVEELDKVLKVDSTRSLSIGQKYEKLHVFVKNTVGEAAAMEMFGSGNLADIELSDLTLAVRKIADAYEKPIRDYENEKARKALSNIPLEKITAMSNAAEKIAAIPAQKEC